MNNSILFIVIISNLTSKPECLLTDESMIFLFTLACNWITCIPYIIYTYFICRYLFGEYSSKVDSNFNIIWILLMVIGASSAYFHATLSLVGQLLDEMAILWVLLAAYAFWTPEWVIQHTGIFQTRWVKVNLVDLH